MHWEYGLHRLELDDEASSNQEVEASGSSKMAVRKGCGFTTGVIGSGVSKLLPTRKICLASWRLGDSYPIRVQAFSLLRPGAD